MASFIESAMRLAFKRPGKQSRMDEEHVGNTSLSSTAPVAVSSTLGGDLGLGQSHLNGEDHPLIFFRMMLGIVEVPHLGFGVNDSARPAPNLGLYKRVVLSEQKAKDSYKVFSIVINACYFLQIILAAALTALGAANANHTAITAFGAINTVIAGFLTFLKGSGLPGRLKYFGNEWKKIREFIEQRERDFSRRDCTLDVHEVVAAVEQMYATTKQEIEMNTPDSYNSIRQTGNTLGTGLGGGGHFNVGKIEGVVNKLRGLDGTIGDLKDRIEKKTHDAHNAAHHIQNDEKDIEAGIQSLGKAVVSEIQEAKPRLTREVSYAVDEAARQARDQVAQTGAHLAADARHIHDQAWDEARTDVARQVRTTAEDLDPEAKQHGHNEPPRR